MNILVIRLSAIGDVLMTTPVLRGLKEKYPGCRISYLASLPASEILEGNPYIDDLIIFNGDYYRNEFKKNPDKKRALIKELESFIKKLQGDKYDLVINLHNRVSTAIFATLSRAAEIRGLYMDFDGELYTSESASDYLIQLYHFNSTRTENEKHFIDIFLEIADVDPSDKNPFIKIKEEDAKYVKNFLKSNSLNKKLIGIHPGSNWPSKRWQREKYAQLMDQIACEFDTDFLIFGGPDENEIAEEIRAMVKSRAVNIAGKYKLGQLPAFIKSCCLFITNDTGPAHIAAAVGTEVIIIFGPTNPKESGPYGNSKIITAKVSCSPCFKYNCDDLRCMKEVSVDEVFQRVKEVLG